MRFLGTLTTRFADRFLEVIEAVRLMSEGQRRRVKIVLAGTGESVKDLREKARDLPEIRFPGWIDAPRIARLMEMSVAGLLPYPNTPDFLDSLPNKFTEYLAGGLPIRLVPQRQGQTPDPRNRLRFSYTEGDPASLTAILVRISEEPALFRGKGKNVKNVFEDPFTTEKVYGSLIDHMERVAAQRTPIK